MSDRAALTRVLEAPWGPLFLAASSRGVVAISLFGPTDRFAHELATTLRLQVREGTDMPAARRHLDGLEEELGAYFDGRRGTFTSNLDLRVGSEWDRIVLEGVRQIPFGHVASYGEVARQIGRFGAARAVGGAVGRNPIAILIPCHRVVGAGGLIGGYGGTWHGTREERLDVKRELLRREGVVLRDSARPA